MVVFIAFVDMLRERKPFGDWLVLSASICCFNKAFVRNCSSTTLSYPCLTSRFSRFSGRVAVDLRKNHLHEAHHASGRCNDTFQSVATHQARDRHIKTDVVSTETPRASTAPCSAFTEATITVRSLSSKTSPSCLRGRELFLNEVEWHQCNASHLFLLFLSLSALPFLLGSPQPLAWPPATL